MMAARVLSDHFDDVTLLERDRFPETPAPRKGLPQGRHVHALLERGRRSLERYFPDLTQELVRAGAELTDGTQDIAMLSPYGWYVQCPSKIQLLSSSRDLIDWSVRSRVAAIPNVRIRQGVDVTGLVRGSDEWAGITGVRIKSRTADFGGDRDELELVADLVVVADGRNSRLPDWLTALNYEAPQESVVNSFQGYASRIYKPPAGFKADWKHLYIQQAPPDHPCGGVLAVIEGGRWVVSLIGGDGHYPPTDEAGFLAFARSLRSPSFYEAILEAEPLTPIVGQRATENRLRHYERLSGFPDGLVVLGDAACAFNPVYGQGMTTATLGAEALDRWLRDEASRLGSGRSRVFQRHLAQAVAFPWRLATGEDYGFRSTEGPPQGRVARLLGRYFDAVVRASTRQAWVRRRLAEVFHMIRSPAALFSPGVLASLTWDWFAGETGAEDWKIEPFREGTEAVRDGVRPTLMSDPSVSRGG